MITFLTILVGLLMLGTLGTLFAGMLGLAKGDSTAKSNARSNALMRWRVTLQGAAIILFALLLTLLRH